MKYIFTIILTFSIHGAFAQHEMSLFFMDDVHQAQRVNPSHIMPHKFNLALPSIGLDYYNSSFRLVDFFRKEGTTWNVDPDEAISRMDATNNRIGQHTRLESLSLALRFGKWQISGWHAINFETHGRYPRNLVEFAWYGNDPYIGDTLSIGPAFDMKTYHEWALGTAFQPNDKWSFGVNLKLLVGLYAIRTMNSDINVHTDPEYYQLTTQTDIRVYTSGLSSGLFSDDGTDGDVLAFTEAADLIIRQNLGFAVDLGATYQYNDQWTFRASATNLGTIAWQDTTYEHTSKGSYTFDGVEANPFDSDEEIDFEQVVDTIEQTFEFAEMNNTFNTPLSPGIFLHAAYRVSDTYELGGMLSGRWYNGQFAPAIAVNAKRALGKHVNVGAFLGYRLMTGANLGFHTDLNFGGFQTFLATDDLFTILLPDYGRGTNVRFGINIRLGRNGSKSKGKAMSDAEKALEKEKKEKSILDNFYNRKN
ncbi:MAG: DUF5723 family protein [Saprospiraceae bacterium]|nr:DUF5723 family protein [Saprospiraceae bacterium]